MHAAHLVGKELILYARGEESVETPGGKSLWRVTHLECNGECNGHINAKEKHTINAKSLCLLSRDVFTVRHSLLLRIISSLTSKLLLIITDAGYIGP